jgi:hypothetical protein
MAWLEVTAMYGRQIGSLHRAFPVAIDGKVSKGEEEQRTKMGWRKRWPVAPGTHTLRVGGGWLKSPEMSFTVEEGQTARFVCESVTAGGTYVLDPRGPDGIEATARAFNAYWLLRSVFQHDVWIRIGQIHRSPDL